jgi:hypothetical protein
VNSTPVFTYCFGISFVLLVILILAIFAWSLSKSEAVLNAWADSNGYEIVRQQRRFFDKGPYFWSPNGWQTVFRVIVRDAQGLTRKAWVRCGNSVLGPLTDQIDVRWDE